MRKRIASAAAVMAAALLLSACVGGADGKGEAEGDLVGKGKGDKCKISDNVKIGSVFSLTEAAAFAGQYQKEGLELAFKELNQKDGVNYDLTVLDDKTNVEESVKAFEDLIDNEKVSAIVGPTLSNQAFSTFEDAQQAGVPALGVSTTAEGIPDIGEYIFRNSLPEQFALEESIPAAKDALDLKNVAILSDEKDEFTSSAYKTMSEKLEDEKIKVDVDEKFSTGDKEFRSQLTKVKDSDPEALVLSALPNETIPLVKQARELGIDAPIIGGNAFNSPVLVNKLGKAAESLIVGGAWSAEADTKGNKEFIEAYKSAYKDKDGNPKEPDQFAAQAYTAAYMIDEAVRTDCDATRDAIKDNLGQILKFKTVLGEISLDESGEVTQDPIVQIVKDGKLTPLK
ncbi:MAG: ABC transporter substrate-binding protein [Stackebrandtia sp.]